MVRLFGSQEQFAALLTDRGPAEAGAEVWTRAVARLRGTRCAKPHSLSRELQCDLAVSHRQLGLHVADVHQGVHNAMKASISEAGFKMLDLLDNLGGEVLDTVATPDPDPPSPCGPGPAPGPAPPLGWEDAWAMLEHSSRGLLRSSACGYLVDGRLVPPVPQSLAEEILAAAVPATPPAHAAMSVAATQTDANDPADAQLEGVLLECQTPTPASTPSPVRTQTMDSETLSGVRSLRSKGHHDGFLHRLAHNQLHDEDVARLVGAGQTDAVSLSKTTAQN